MAIFHALVAIALVVPAGASTLKGESDITVCNADVSVRLEMTATPLVYTGASYYSGVTVSSGSGAHLGGPARRNSTKPRLLPGESVRLSWTATGSDSVRLSLTDVGPVTGSQATVTPRGLGDHTYTLSAVGECGAAGSRAIHA